MKLTLENTMTQELTKEIELHINHQLYIKGYITEDMYIKANEMICKYCSEH